MGHDGTLVFSALRCFQRPVKSDLPITAPRSQSPASALEAPANLSIAASVEASLQFLWNLLVVIPEK